MAYDITLERFMTTVQISARIDEALKKIFRIVIKAVYKVSE